MFNHLLRVVTKMTMVTLFAMVPFWSVFADNTKSDAVAEPLAGTWTLTIDTPRGVQHPKLEILRSDAGYSGTYHSLRGPIPIPAIMRRGNQFEFPLIISIPIGEITVTYRGSTEAGSMRGVVQNPRGAVPFTGQRDP